MTQTPSQRSSCSEMGIVSQEAILQLQALRDPVHEPLNKTFQNVHQDYRTETLVRFLKAREWSVVKAPKMLVDCLHWRVQNDIDDILTKPIVPTELYRAVRESQLIGMSGYSREVLTRFKFNQGLPVFAIGVGLSTFDKASVHYHVQSHIQINEYRDCAILPSASKKHGRPITTCIKVLDMTGLKLSALSQIKVVKPLLQERKRKKIQVLPGCGREELLKIMDFASLPHFCRKNGSGSSRNSENENCFSLDHPSHQQIYNYIKQQSLIAEPAQLIKQGSFHVDLPEPAAEGTEIAKTLEFELHKFERGNGLSKPITGIKINDD